MKLLGQDEFAELGGLQAVDRAVVVDGHGLVALQQCVAVQCSRVEGFAVACSRWRGASLVCVRGAPKRGRGHIGLHGDFRVGYYAFY